MDHRRALAENPRLGNFALFRLAGSTPRGPHWQRTSVFRLVEIHGRWSMLDILRTVRTYLRYVTPFPCWPRWCKSNPLRRHRRLGRLGPFGAVVVLTLSRRGTFRRTAFCGNAPRMTGSFRPWLGTPKPSARPARSRWHDWVRSFGYCPPGDSLFWAGASSVYRSEKASPQGITVDIRFPQCRIPRSENPKATYKDVDWRK